MHRLRDLDRRQGAIAAVLVALLVVPFVVSLARAADVGWLPSGDDALIGLRSFDALGPDRALIGQPSTSHLYSDGIDTHHPGPIEFFWLAVPMRVLGAATGMLAGIAVVNLACVLVALWVVLRRAGPGVAAWSAVLVSGVLWSQGTALLSDPISSSAGSYGLLALAATAWAVADGDVRLAPLGALLASWVLQQHLAIVLPAAALVGFAVVGLLLGGVARFRRPTPEAGGRWWPWLAGALVVLLVLWSPVLWQQATGDPGNVSEVIEYAQISDRPTVGWGDGARQAVRAVGFPPLLVQWDLQGPAFKDGPLAWYDLAAALATAIALAATVVLGWRRRRPLAVLALLALVLAPVGVATGASIPDSVEAFRANFYRWMFVEAWVALTALGWAAALGARRALARTGRSVPSGLAPLGAALAAVAVLIPAVATVASAPSFDDERRDERGFGLMRDASEAAIERAEDVGATRVTLVPRGHAAVLSSTAAMAVQLEEAGYEVRVPPELEARFWGEHRILQPGEDPGLALQLVTALGPVPEGPGEVLLDAGLNDELRSVLDPLAAQARGAEIVLATDADRVLRQQVDDPDQRAFLAAVVERLPDDPETVLTSPAVLELLAAGYLAEPALDPDDLRSVIPLLPLREVNLDDRFELRAIDDTTLAELVPSWADG